MPDFKQLVAALLIASLSGCQEQRTVEDVFRQGYSAFEADDGAVLVTSLRHLERLEPDDDHTRLLQALISLRGSDPLTALKLLEQVDADGPLRQFVLLHGATAYYQLGLIHQAQRMLAMLTEEFPDDADGHRWAGIVYYDLGAYDFAIVHLKRVVELEPTDYRPLRLLGIMYCDFERNTDAIDVLIMALKLDPPQHVRLEMIEQLARSRIAERQYDDALKLLGSGPVGTTGRALTAECLFNLGESAAALKAIGLRLKI